MKRNLLITFFLFVIFYICLSSFNLTNKELIGGSMILSTFGLFITGIIDLLDKINKKLDKTNKKL